MNRKHFITLLALAFLGSALTEERLEISEEAKALILSNPDAKMEYLDAITGAGDFFKKNPSAYEQYTKDLIAYYKAEELTNQFTLEHLGQLDKLDKLDFASVKSIYASLGVDIFNGRDGNCDNSSLKAGQLMICDGALLVTGVRLDTSDKPLSEEELGPIKFKNNRTTKRPKIGYLERSGY